MKVALDFRASCLPGAGIAVASVTLRNPTHKEGSLIHESTRKNCFSAYLFGFAFEKERVSLRSPRGHRTQYVEQYGFKFKEIHFPCLPSTGIKAVYSCDWPKKERIHFMEANYERINHT